MKTVESEIVGVGGVTLRTTVWSQHDETTAPVADVVLVHGYGEHSGRYRHVAEYLVEQNFRVSTFDLRGHGRSTGVTRGTVDSFEAVVDDVATFVDSVRSELPLFLYGHSMGGLAVVRTAERDDSGLAGIVVASAALAPAESIPVPLLKVANVLGKIAPKLPTIQLDGDAISRVESVRTDYDHDPLNYRGKVSAGTAREMNMAMAEAMAQAKRISLPVLVVHGEKDTLTSVSGSRAFVSAVSSKDITLKTWPDAFHELHNEPEADDVLSTIGDWITSHATAAESSQR